MIFIVLLSLAAIGASFIVAPGVFEPGVGVPSTPISRGFTPVDKWRFIRQACSSPCFGGCCNSGGPCCPWMACCQPGYVCAPINGKNGCCPTGQNCSTIAPNACQQPGYVPCSGANLCCPQGAICTTNPNDGTPICDLSGISNSGTASPSSTLPAVSIPGASTTPPATAPATSPPPVSISPAATSTSGGGGSSGGSNGGPAPNASVKTQTLPAVIGIIAIGIAMLL